MASPGPTLLNELRLVQSDEITVDEDTCSKEGEEKDEKEYLFPEGWKQQDGAEVLLHPEGIEDLNQEDRERREKGRNIEKK